MTRYLLLPLFLIGCNDKDDDSGGVGDSGVTSGDGGDEAYGCIETERSEVDDPSVVPDGFDFAADVVLVSAVGSFNGQAILRDASDKEQPPVDLDFDVGTPSAIWAVLRAFNDGGSDTGPGIGAEPDPSTCTPFYEAEVALVMVTTDGQLDESVGAVMSIFDATGASTGFSLDVAALGGTLAPSFDPSAYDSTTLSMSATTTATGWAGDLQWSATRELADGVGEGIVGPAGSFEVSAAAE
jgi:hypothetical protein